MPWVDLLSHSNGVRGLLVMQCQLQQKYQQVSPAYRPSLLSSNSWCLVTVPEVRTGMLLHLV